VYQLQIGEIWFVPPFARLAGALPMKRMGRVRVNSFTKFFMARHFTERYFEAFRRFYQLADAVQVHAEWVRDILLINGVSEKKIFYFPQFKMLPGHHSDEIYTRIEDDKNPFQIAFIGRCEHIKGIHLLVKAVKLIAPNDFLLKVHFFGPPWKGDYAESLKK
jgi:glycosyltransferase involved in cell wall biosynthesis